MLDAARARGDANIYRSFPQGFGGMVFSDVFVGKFCEELNDFPNRPHLIFAGSQFPVQFWGDDHGAWAAERIRLRTAKSAG